MRCPVCTLKHRLFLAGMIRRNARRGRRRAALLALLTGRADIAVFGLALALFAGAAQAGSATLGTSAATVVAAKTSNGGYRSVSIANQSAAATVSCTDDASPPVKGAAGSYDIPPGATRHWGDSNVVFVGPFTCISDTAATPVTYTAE